VATQSEPDAQIRAARVPAPSEGSAASGYGWIAFAAIMAALAGTFNVIDGVVALTHSSFFRPSAQYLFSDLDTWAWILIVAGCVEIAAAVALGTGSQLARWTCIVTVGVNALIQLLVVQAYPAWALSVFALDLLVIYALVVYAGSRLRS
jgi:hypothetical protein